MSCNTPADCRAAKEAGGSNACNWLCTNAHTCLIPCTQQSDCVAPDVCDQLICRPPACGDDSECNSCQKCIGGACAAAVQPSAVASCVVLPENALLNAGGTKTFSIVTYDSTGAAVPYETDCATPVTWSAPSPLTASTSSTDVSATFTAPTSAASATGTIGASIGSTTCTPAHVTEYAAAAQGSVRVVVTDLGSATPISGATVVAEDGSSLVTGGDGSATFSNLTAAMHDISVFATGHSYVSVLQTSATDLLIPLKPVPNPGVFNGVLTGADFNNVSDPTGTLHLFIAGPSIGGNLIDLSLATLLGPGRMLPITLGTGTTYNIPDLPGGIDLGLSATMFGPGSGGQYVIEAAPGHRVLWSLGGNLVIGTVLQILGPLLSGGTGNLQMEIPQILTGLLPLVGKLESGVTSGVPVMPGEMQSLAYGTSPQPALELNTLMRLKLNVKTPVLPSYQDDTGATVPFDGVVILGGALAPTQGLVPLGLTAGVDKESATGAMTPDGLTDPATMGAQEQQLPLSLAARHGGLETAPWAYVTLGASLESLFGSFGSSGSSGSTGTILAGTIVYAPNKLTYNNAGKPDYTNPVDLSHPFIGTTVSGTSLTGSPIPVGAAFNPTTRAFTPPAAVSGATFHRLDIGKDGTGWSIYFPASMDGSGATPVSIPTPPGTYADPVTATGQSATLMSVSLGYPAPGAEGPETYDGVVQFDGIDLDDMTLETDSFSVRALPVTAN